MNEKFRFEFFDPEKKKVVPVMFDSTEKYSVQTEAWLDATIRACVLARENQWILLEVEVYYIGEKGDI